MTTEATPCKHYWIIDEARDGRTSPGTCRKCGETREFSNVIEYDMMDVLRGKKDQVKPRTRRQRDTTEGAT